MGVWLFFVISGFVVTKSLLDRERIGEPPIVTFRNFMIRRVLRIWPIYYAYLFLGLAVTLLVGEAIDWKAVAFMSTLTYNYYLIEHGRIFGSWPTASCGRSASRNSSIWFSVWPSHTSEATDSRAYCGSW
jgi:peptidoglycan/LPS O-acetylase OafA/YrhL